MDLNVRYQCTNGAVLYEKLQCRGEEGCDRYLRCGEGGEKAAIVLGKNDRWYHYGGDDPASAGTVKVVLYLLMTGLLA